MKIFQNKQFRADSKDFDSLFTRIIFSVNIRIFIRLCVWNSLYYEAESLKHLSLGQTTPFLAKRRL